MKKRTVVALSLCAFMLTQQGCALIFQNGRRSETEKIRRLEKELNEFKKAKSALETRLANELRGNQVRVDETDRGLVITFDAEILFDSGKAALKNSCLPILDTITTILNEEASGNGIAIEGHTDNQPIKHSRWASNFELSSHRALSVLYYLQDKGIEPERLSAVGYGEYRPIESNDSRAGRAKNRRVEIIILPLGTKQVEKRPLGSVHTESQESFQSDFDDEELK